MSVEDSGTAEQEAASSPATDEAGEPKLRVENITKQFGRIVALDDVTLDIQEAEIFALVGDNGAGKSTLMNVLSGVHSATKGTIYKDGREVHFSNPSDARDNGIETVYQDLALMDDLDIATNIFMGQFPKRGLGPFSFIDWETTYEQSRAIMMDQLGRDVDIKTEVEFLSGGQRQLVAVGRALAFDPDVIILDEPTSALSVDATRLVQDTLDRLAEEGITIVIVSHNIESVLAHADRIGVLYQGRLVDIKQPEETDLEELNELMTTGTLDAGLLDDD
ncbi:ATP-binding cassette domain-containing protein [Haloarcula pellucida]|uniref:ABC transporter ATP-binding protein n=1 Tax=Haloarcula pellucida TaxID=1427151 RepID=A0A830GH07_9EURY|nr:ATP-binding cassette domain-containing protein [Halomicroarcula pellucida]MBX0347422.1 ATP-binding cassette domain-containing protein [Halomicroarcula pellucida]GGN88592.1 ABC transporter ATP-binding protein [Halomicroarcula pellucida]